MGFRDEVKQIEQDNLKMPSLFQEAKNLMETVGDSVSMLLHGENPILSAAENERRLAICNVCEKYSHKRDRCSLCGCNMPIKAWLKAGYCKLGKFDTNDKVSVMIASYKEQYLDRTIASLVAMAEGPIEILVMEDEKQEGTRVLFNRMAKLATGKYLYSVDAHCRLTQGWDVKMKAACGDTDLVISMIDALDEKSWNCMGHNYGLVYLDKDLQDKWWSKKSDSVIAETMGLTGCSVMITKKRYWELGGFDESFTRWGSMGPELALKIWLSGGRCLLHTEVTCGHLFRKPGEETHNVPVSEIEKTIQQIKDITYRGQWPQQRHSIGWLVGRFKEVPTWDRTMQYPERVEWVSVTHT